MIDKANMNRGGDRFELDMDPEAFRRAGHALVDTLAEFLATIADRPVTPAESAEEVRSAFPPTRLPERGVDAGELLQRITPLLLDHSLYNGHPQFLGYITSSPAPLGVLADLLAATINQNCGLRDLSPAANEIELQTIDWLAELIGYPRPCGGIMVSGGNVANMLGFFAARKARLSWPVRSEGLSGHAQPLVYASRGTHTWLEKAVDVAGMGSGAVRWVDTDRDQRIDLGSLERLIEADRESGRQAFLVIGTAGNVSTGAVDPLASVADIAERHGLWFHVDGAYGAPAAMLPDGPPELSALHRADSVALDPHKWLYNPIEAACTLVRDPGALRDAFSYKPPYYQLGVDPSEVATDFYEHGLQNTRGFRALKTWLCIQQTGREGYTRRIGEDIDLARYLYDQVEKHPELDAGTCHLSITTFRYGPDALVGALADEQIDEINLRTLARVNASGEAFVSNAVLEGRQYLRACIVNFRTRREHIDHLIDLVVRAGREAARA